MNAGTKHFKFLQRIQQYVGQDINIQSKDIEFFLNKGLDAWVQSTYDAYKGQEELRKRLGSIIVTEILPNTDSAGVNSGVYGGEVWTLPADVLYVLDEVINTASPVPVKPVDFNYYNKQRNNPFKKAGTRVVWRLDVDDSKHELVGHSGAITNYRVSYVKYPDRIVLHGTQDDTDVDIRWEDEIVDKAVEIAYATYSVSGSLKTNEK
jgi:hypothetical protein